MISILRFSIFITICCKNILCLGNIKNIYFMSRIPHHEHYLHNSFNNDLTNTYLNKYNYISNSINDYTIGNLINLFIIPISFLLLFIFFSYIELKNNDNNQ